MCGAPKNGRRVKHVWQEAREQCGLRIVKQQNKRFKFSVQGSAQIVSSLFLVMALNRLSQAELRSRLLEMHQEEAPRNWSRTQLLLRLSEIEGMEVIHKTPKEMPPLRQAEIMINKAARKKCTLIDLVENQMKISLSGNETIEQLKLKALNQAYNCSPAHPQDPVGFGVHAAKTYGEVAAQEVSYMEWAIKTKNEGQCCPRLKRLAEWGESALGQAMMKEGKSNRPGSAKDHVNRANKPSSSRLEEPTHNLVANLATQVEALTKELNALKSQKARKTRNEGDETTSSDWDRMSSAPSAA